MTTTTTKVGNFVRKHKVLCIFLTIFIVGAGIWALINLTPRPLGNQMEYLGKEDFGNVLGFDYSPYSVYYYGTNIDTKDIDKYFNDAEIRGQRSDRIGTTSVGIKLNNKNISIEYYVDKSLVNFTTDKKYIISVTSENYRILRKSIR